MLGINSTRRTGGNYSQNCTIGNADICCPGTAFGIFSEQDDFQCWRVNLKTEVCVRTLTPELTVSWIDEVEIARSVDDLMTSQSIKGESFLDFEMLGARIASVLRMIISITSFRKRVSVEEQ